MAKLIYITNTSLDGYIEDQKGNFDWLNADQVHEFITELIRPMRTYLLGRRLYETMASWESPMESFPPEQRAFAEVWQKFEKIVFSRTLTDVKGKARLEREFDADAVRKLKQESEHDISIGGAEIAGAAMEANLIDECHLFLYPIVIGGGKPAFRPALRRRLELIETSNFSTGVIYVRYRITA